MANTKISNLTSAGTLTGSEVAPIVQSGSTVKATAQNIADLAIPSQTGQNGKYLTTNGTIASWDAIDISTADVTGTLPIANGGTGQTSASNAINALLPSQTGQNGNYLTTNGTIASWGSVSGGEPAYQFKIDIASGVFTSTLIKNTTGSAVTVTTVMNQVYVDFTNPFTASKINFTSNALLNSSTATFFPYAVIVGTTQVRLFYIDSAGALINLSTATTSFSIFVSIIVNN